MPKSLYLEQYFMVSTKYKLKTGILFLLFLFSAISMRFLMTSTKSIWYIILYFQGKEIILDTEFVDHKIYCSQSHYKNIFLVNNFNINMYFLFISCGIVYHFTLKMFCWFLFRFHYLPIPGTYTVSQWIFF